MKNLKWDFENQWTAISKGFADISERVDIVLKWVGIIAEGLALISMELIEAVARSVIDYVKFATLAMWVIVTMSASFTYVAKNYHHIGDFVNVMRDLPR